MRRKASGLVMLDGPALDGAGEPVRRYTHYGLPTQVYHILNWFAPPHRWQYGGEVHDRLYDGMRKPADYPMEGWVRVCVWGPYGGEWLPVLNEPPSGLRLCLVCANTYKREGYKIEH